MTTATHAIGKSSEDRHRGRAPTYLQQLDATLLLLQTVLQRQRLLDDGKVLATTQPQVWQLRDVLQRSLEYATHTSQHSTS